MKRTLALLLAVVLFNGCTQYKKLMGEARPDQDPENISGVWTGEANIPDWGPGETPHPQTLTLRIEQGNINILNAGSYVMTEGGRMAIGISGSIAGRSFSTISGEMSLCPNRWTFNGNVAEGGLMTLQIDGEGNSYGACYDHPIHQTIYLTR